MSPGIAHGRPDAPHVRGIGHTPVHVYLAVVLPVAIALGAVAVQPWLLPSDLLRDGQAVAAAHGSAATAYGLLSNLGIVVLAASAGAAFVGRLALRGTADRLRPLLAWSAALSLALALDDLLLLHETATFLPWAGALFVGAYGAAFVIFVVWFRAPIRQELDAGLLVITAAALAASAVVDVVIEPPTQWSVFIEDGAKLLGVVAWSAFVMRAAILALDPARPHGRAAAGS